MGSAVKRFGGFIRQAADKAGDVLREAEEIGSLRKFGADVDLLAPFRSGTSSASAPAPAPAPAPTPAPTPTPPPAPEPVAAAPEVESETEQSAIESTRRGRASTMTTGPQGLMAVAPEQVRRRRSLMGGLIS
jgi:pyruvate/2-oxoglutarate dehydrogenase complex dihydrolipoamide acyltransferase (E2) component